MTALGVGVAGCSSDSDGEQTTTGNAESGNGGSENGGSGQTAAADRASTAESAETGTAAKEMSGKDPSATEMTGTVADKSVSGLTFVEQNQYSMNGVQGVVGTVKNTSDAAFSEVTIHTTVKPGDAGPYTETMDGSLEPGATWEFKYRFGDDAPEEIEGYTIWATGQKA